MNNMDLKKIVLLMALGYVVLMLWQAWQKDYAPKTIIHSPSTNQQAQSTTKNNINNTVPTAIPSHTTSTTPTAPTHTKITQAGHLITVKTDVLDIKINTLGGNIVKSGLVKYPLKRTDPNNPVVLLNNKPDSLYIAKSGLTGPQGPDTQKGQVQYTAAKSVYEMQKGQDVLAVNLVYKNPQGIKFTKSFIFNRNKYLIDVKYTIDNKSAKAWSGNFYAQLIRKSGSTSHSMMGFHSYMGAAISSPEEIYKKVTFKDMRESPVKQSAKSGWVAMVQHYFVSAWIPNKDQNYNYYTQSLGNDEYLIGMVGPSLMVQPGKELTTNSQFYVGPEIAKRLKSAAKGLNLTIDYGFLWPISTAIFWLMAHIYKIIGNWGWAIVLVTLIIKLMFYKLSEKSYRSMANMRKLQPKITALKERFGDDKQKMGQATMELYKKEKINPLGGCLPIIVQIPVFIALYWVLLESVEFRQAPFIFWIHDLSVKDPYYILPLLMGATMFLQQKLNPAPPDPMQAKIMMLMPVVFTVFFLNFPSGLVLYWLVNNVLSVTQQWYIMKKVEAGDTKKLPKVKNATT